MPNEPTAPPPPADGGRMLRALIAGGLLALALLGAWELGWRAYGYTAGLSDNDNEWALERTRLRPNDPDVVVFAGTSRSERALLPAVWAAQTGMPRPHQLSIAGSASQEILHHLAVSDDFRGLVLIDLAPATYIGYARDSAFVRVVASRLQAYNTMRVSPARQSETRLRQACELSLVSFSPKLALPAFYRRWEEGRPDWFFVDPAQVRRFEETEDPAAFADARATMLRRTREAAQHLRALPEGELLSRRDAMAESLTRDVNAIQARGGAVVFVHHPISGDLKRLLEQLFPRAMYWDYFATHVPGVWIHYADYPSTRDVTAIEESHLSQKTAEAYTPNLLRIVVEKLTPIGMPRGGTLYAPESPLGQALRRIP